MADRSRLLVKTYHVRRGQQTYTLNAQGWRDEVGNRVSGREAEWLFSILYVTLNAEDVLATDDADLLERARDARLLAHFRRAERLCRRFHQRNPQHDGGLAVFSSVLRSLRRPLEAIELTQNRAGSRYGPLLTSRAAAFCDLKRWDDARATLSSIPESQQDYETSAVAARIERMSAPPAELFEAQVQFEP